MHFINTIQNVYLQFTTCSYDGYAVLQQHSLHERTADSTLSSDNRFLKSWNSKLEMKQYVMTSSQCMLHVWFLSICSSIMFLLSTLYYVLVILSYHVLTFCIYCSGGNYCSYHKGKGTVYADLLVITIQHLILHQIHIFYRTIHAMSIFL